MRACKQVMIPIVQPRIAFGASHNIGTNNIPLFIQNDP